MAGETFETGFIVLPATTVPMAGQAGSQRGKDLSLRAIVGAQIAMLSRRALEFDNL
jgi:hypothetical protein